MNTINTSDYIGELKSLLHDQNIQIEDILSVEDIKAWCVERSIPETNPWRTGKCLRNSKTGDYLILMAARITTEMVNSILGAISTRGFDTTELNNEDSFLIHLLFHEVGHAKNANWTESECNQFAFEELRKTKANR